MLVNTVIKDRIAYVKMQDGKHFNMSYIPSKVLSGGETKQVIRAEQDGTGN